MPKFTRNFVAGKMNKTFDERVVPNGEYIDAMNIRMGSTENSEFGVIENTKGNISLTTLRFENTLLSVDARCIGAYEDGSIETIYWFVHDPSFPLGATGKLDLIVSFNTNTLSLTYHVITIDNGGGVDTTLNFNPQYLITGVNKIQELLFFTDNYNAPRSININRSYAIPVGFIDAGSIPAALLLEESLLVIKRPPVESPTVQLVNTQGEQNFMEERFISFAYRYLYADGEYSATSQWSDIAFSPNGFELTIEAYLNEGMINAFNACQVTYWTGNSLVLGIDLLFKQSESNIIKIIEKQNKADLGIANDTYKTLTFDNSKIFTVLPEAELLRLYDNVPRFAQAQTLMGNRIMYGNYVEGYDLVSLNGQPLQLTYEAKLIQEDIASEALDSSAQTSVYDIDITNPSWSVPNSILRIDFASFGPNYNTTLIVGATIQVQLEFTHDSYTGGTPTTQTGNTNISLTFTLAQNYLSPYALSQSTEFQEWVGTLINILPVYDPIPATPTSCDGSTLTDYFNCAIPANQASGWQKRASGITAIDEPIAIIASNLNTYIDLQLVAMQYEDVNNLGTYAYEYYSIVDSIVTFNKLGNARSLHSNRGYEIGIVYMDDFLRSSTALVSPLNAVYTPCSSSANKNSIEVTIPVSQVAPYWATRYKFVIKPDQEGYQTIYSTLVVQDVDSLFWFLLEGENMQKVEVGDRLIVKKDSSGPTEDCIYTTVLEKIAKQKDATFIIEGVYMRLEAGNFASQVSPVPIYDVYSIGTSDLTSLATTRVIWSDPAFPVPPALTYTDLDVPVGSTIGIMLYTYRKPIGGCGPREVNGANAYSYFTANQSYASLESWFLANQTAIMSTFNALQEANMSITFNGVSALSTAAMNTFVTSSISSDVMKLYINRDPVTNMLTFHMSGTEDCYPVSYKSIAKLYFSLQRTTISPEFIFETLPIDALPDVFFENNLSFTITPIGEHNGNVANQDFALGQDAVIDTGFFNCFSFGNGVESYKVRDSIVGREFNLGERVTSVSSQDYKEAHRFSDITYSGIYNPETNLNKLNEFNLGLLNYKYLESSFGYIYVLDGRETDVLCLQEDKVSYVLAGKNLLSDAGAGRALTAVPEVLGTQIARTEKYGISHNPESYVQWGADRYFTDTKRGAVIHIQGDSMQSDQLQVVSELGMRTWFRDEFINTQTTQKLGGYDPYMNEYVLTSNDIEIPNIIDCFGCGQINSFNIDNTDKPERVISYCVKLTNCVADGNIVLTTFNLSNGDPSSGLISIDVTYDGTTTSNSINGVGTISVPYSVNNPLVLELQIVITIAPNAIVTFNVDNQCQECTEIFLVQVVITDGSNAGMFIHNQYNYFDPLIPYSSPLQSNQVTFALPSSNPLVSYYNIDAGFWGQGSFPYPGVDTNLYTNKIGTDDFDVLVPPNKFLYHTSNTFYPNNQIDITTLLSVATDITPLTQPSVTQWKGTFTTPALQNFLYLIWDLRQSTAVELCFDAEDCITACADCYTPPPCNCGSWLVVNNNPRIWSSIGYVDCNGNNAIIGDEGTYGYDFPAYGALFICARDFPAEFREPTFTYMYLGCYCCSNQCVNFEVVSTSAATIEFLGLVNCGATIPSSTIFNPMSTTSLCVNDYFDAGYFTIPQGIADVESLDFQFQECGCEGICCSTYYFYSAIDQDISYIDCGGNLMEISIKSSSGLFICLSEIVDSGTTLVTQLNECQCCATECYTILATNNSASIINIIAAPPATCFGEGTVSILAGGVALICVGEGTLLDYSGGNAANLDMEFVECDCLPL
jgi:hypothetical protein